MKKDEINIPGIGERMGFCVKRGEAMNGTVKRIEITERGVWVTMRITKTWNRRAKDVRLQWPGGIQGWTRIKTEIVLVTFQDEIAKHG